MLSVNQVDSYLTTNVNFPDWKSVLARDRIEFLQLFVRKHVCNVYFHNLELALPDPEERSVPTETEIIDNGLPGKGGLCNQLNRFAKHLLDALGFETYNVAASWSVSPVSGTHCVLIVEMTSNNAMVERYLVDIGSGSPNYETIPLHQLPFRGKAGGYEYEFRLAPDQRTYQRVQFTGSLIKGDFAGHEEELRYSFQLIPVTLEEIQPAMAYIYTNPSCYLFKMPFLFRHVETEEGMEFLLVWGKTMVKGKVNSREIVKLGSYDELEDFLINNSNCFPKLDRLLLKVTFAKFKQFEVIPYRF